MATETEAYLGKTDYKVVGTRPIRHDGEDKVTGRAIYGADVGGQDPVEGADAVNGSIEDVTVLDLLQGMAKEKQWREYVAKGATAMDLSVVQAIFQAPIRAGSKHVDLNKLRNKALAVMLAMLHTSSKVRFYIINIASP